MSEKKQTEFRFCGCNLHGEIMLKDGQTCLISPVTVFDVLAELTRERKISYSECGRLFLQANEWRHNLTDEQWDQIEAFEEAQDAFEMLMNQDRSRLSKLNIN